jgi:hypothetical protein
MESVDADTREQDISQPETPLSSVEHDEVNSESKVDNSTEVGCITFYAIAVVIIIIVVGWATWVESLDLQEENNASRSSGTENTPVPTISPTPIIFSDVRASASLLEANDFPKNWTVTKTGIGLQAENDYLTDFDVKKIKLTLQTHETEAAAQAAFSTQKAEAQTTIDDRGISGDKLEDVKKYPLFVWNASTQANISGIEKWTVVGVYGNITMRVYHEGSMGAPKKSFAVDIAKKQIDRIKGD